MNRIFKVIFSKVLGINVVCGEHARSHGKKSLKALATVALAAGLACVSGQAMAAGESSYTVDGKTPPYTALKNVTYTIWKHANTSPYYKFVFYTSVAPETDVAPSGRSLAIAVSNGQYDGQGIGWAGKEGSFVAGAAWLPVSDTALTGTVSNNALIVTSWYLGGPANTGYSSVLEVVGAYSSASGGMTGNTVTLTDINNHNALKPDGPQSPSSAQPGPRPTGPIEIYSAHAMAATELTGNRVTIQNSVFSNAEIAGARTESTSADVKLTNNSVSIGDSTEPMTISSGQIYGTFGKGGQATGNTVTLTNVSLTTGDKHHSLQSTL